MFLSLLTGKSKEEKELASFIHEMSNSQDVQVVGRGTIFVEPKRIFDTPEFKEGLERAALLVNK